RQRDQRPSSQLPLDTRIELHYIGAVRTILHHVLPSQYKPRAVDQRKCIWKHRIADAAQNVIRRLAISRVGIEIAPEFAVENPKAGSDARLPIAERVPSNAQAWSEIQIGGVGERRPGGSLRIVQAAQIRQQSVLLARNGDPLIAQSQI